MANMSYCRFQNTAQDLRDCANNLHDDDLSKDEKQARAQLIRIAREIVQEADNWPELEE